MRINYTETATRQGHTDGTRLVPLLDLPVPLVYPVRDVDAGDRCSFRGAIAFVDLLVELELEGIPHLGVQSFGTGHHHPQ